MNTIDDLNELMTDLTVVLKALQETAEELEKFLGKGNLELNNDTRLAVTFLAGMRHERKKHAGQGSTGSS